MFIIKRNSNKLFLVETQAILFNLNKINVGKSRVRHGTTLNLNNPIFNRFESI